MITKLFLKAKHWQIFVLMFGVPILFELFVSGCIIEFLGSFSIAMLLMFLFITMVLTWFWSIGVGLHKFLPVNHNLNLKKFKIFVFIPIVYTLILLFGTPIDGIINNLLILSLHLFSMFCMFYMIYHCAKTIRSIEINKEAVFSDYVGEFFLLWFYIVGIWILQPKINKIYSDKENNPRDFKPEILTQTNE